MISLEERLEITAPFCAISKVLRIALCKVGGMGKYREGGAVGMFHVMVSLGKWLCCVLGVYCWNQENKHNN